MEVNLDISLQISQLHKRGNAKKYKGCAMGLVTNDKQIKNSIYLSKKELKEIIKIYEKDLPLKTIYVKIHSIMIFLCLEPYLPKIKLIKLCRDFNPTILTKELYCSFPCLKNYKIKWVGGKGNKSIADKYANKVRKYPEYANNILTVEKINLMETPHIRVSS